ncbi:MAG: dibenzothiophene desulfurase, partial [Alphaproteobacteria bacterium]
LGWLGLGGMEPGPAGTARLVVALALAAGGLLASVAHLARPERMWRGFSQWRTSWLSREAVLAVAALAAFAPEALARLAALVGLGLPRPPEALAMIGGALALATVLATAMIYAQLATVPRWRQALTPVVFVLAALAGGALLAGWPRMAGLMMLALALAQIGHWLRGDARWATRSETTAGAIGLAGRGRARLLEPPHSGEIWLTREMVHVVGRRHRGRLRRLSALALGLAGALLLALPPTAAVQGMALGLHVLGLLAARWLFYAEAEHVVRLYYDARGG